jgi:hypothetical protein
LVLQEIKVIVFISVLRKDHDQHVYTGNYDMVWYQDSTVGTPIDEGMTTPYLQASQQRFSEALDSFGNPFDFEVNVSNIPVVISYEMDINGTINGTRPGE